MADVLESVDWVAEITVRAEPGLLASVDDGWLRVKALDAVAMIVDRVPQVTSRLGSGRLSLRTVCRIVTDMVLRVARNPAGLRSENDGTYGYTTSAVVASGDLWIPDKDLELLRGATVGAPSSVTVTPQKGWG